MTLKIDSLILLILTASGVPLGFNFFLEFCAFGFFDSFHELQKTTVNIFCLDESRHDILYKLLSSLSMNRLVEIGNGTAMVFNMYLSGVDYDLGFHNSS